MTEIVLARRPAELAAVKHLFLEYAASLDFALDCQDFDVEMANFPRLYAPPAGGPVLTRVDGAAAGAVGFRPLERGICELKRLFVRPADRRLGLGRILAERIIAEARAKPYRAIRLDTIGPVHAGGDRALPGAGISRDPGLRLQPDGGRDLHGARPRLADPGPTLGRPSNRRTPSPRHFASHGRMTGRRRSIRYSWRTSPLAVAGRRDGAISARRRHRS